MSQKEELQLIRMLLGKYNLPISPILEYAISKKIEECGGEYEAPFLTEHKVEEEYVFIDNGIGVPLSNETPQHDNEVIDNEDELRKLYYSQGYTPQEVAEKMERLTSSSQPVSSSSLQYGRG